MEQLPLDIPPGQPVQMPPAQAKPVSYAGFWKRFLAYIIDNIIISVVSFVILLPLLAMIGLAGFGMASSGDENADAGVILGSIGMLLGAYLFFILIVFIGEWLYFALMESKKGATLGKMALGIKVTDLSGNPVSFGKATGRYFGKILSSLIFCIGYIMVAFTQQKQGLHDLLAGTLVVNK